MMNILLIDFGSAHGRSLNTENGHREEMASMILSGVDLSDELQEANVYRFNIVDIPDEATDYVIDYDLFSSDDGDDSMSEYIYYVVNGKICRETNVIASSI